MMTDVNRPNYVGYCALGLVQLIVVECNINDNPFLLHLCFNNNKNTT